MADGRELDDLLLLSTILHLEDEEDAEEEEEEQQLRLLAASIVLAGEEEGRRQRIERRHTTRRLYLTRPDLIQNPREGTPWQVLYERQSDRAFITTMGLNVETFHAILDAGFAEGWNFRSVPRNDVSATSEPRPYRRSLDAAGALGLILHHLSSTMREITLQQIFAIIPTTCSRYIQFSLTLLLRTLRSMHDARISWPKAEEFPDLTALVQTRHPHLIGAFGTTDGLNILSQTSEDLEVENSTYNGWLHDHFISSVLAFAATGKSC